MVTPNFDIDCSWQVLHLWQIIHKEDMVTAIVIDVNIDTIEGGLSNGAIVNDLEWPWRSLQLWNVYNSIPLKHLFTSPAGAVPKYCDEYVCLCVCVSVREDISETTRAILTNFPVLVTYGRGSVLLRQSNEMTRGIPPNWQCIVTRSLQKGSFNRQ